MDYFQIKEAAEKFPAHVLQPFDAIMEVVGAEGIFAIIKYLGGKTVYVPQARRIFKSCIYEDIRQKYDDNYSLLANEYNLSERHIRRIVTGN